MPTIWKDAPYTDCSRFPARRGFVDILQLYNRLPLGTRRSAWTAAAIPSRGYLWYSLKDPTVLPSTVMWMENHGRHGSPWNGRNLCIGLEEVCALFADGLAPSLKPNAMTIRGIPTAIKLTAARARAVKTIQGVVRIPRAFDRVKRVRFGRGAAEFVSENGKTAGTRVNHEFLFTADATGCPGDDP